MAILLNAINEFIDMGDVLDEDGTDPFSISAWFRTTKTADDTILSKMLGSGDFNGYQFRVDTENFAIKFDLINTIANRIQVHGSTDVHLGAWHHGIVTYDGSKAVSGVELYVDGVVETKTTLDDTLTGSTTTIASLNIGARNTVNNFFLGDINDVRKYDRVLSVAEAQTIFAARGVDGIVAGLVGRWVLNEDSPGVVVSGSSVIKDRSKNGNNGTPAGTSPEFSAGELRFRRRVS